MRVLVNFMHRQGWPVHRLADDAKTSISPCVNMREQTTLVRLLRACGLTDEGMTEVERDIRAWGQGSVWVNVNEMLRK